MSQFSKVWFSEIRGFFYISVCEPLSYYVEFILLASCPVILTFTTSSAVTESRYRQTFLQFISSIFYISRGFFI